MNTTRALPHIPGASANSLIDLIALAHAIAPGFISTVVDGGAGIGDTIAPLVSISPTIRVIAYEPLPENVAILKSRFAGMPSVTIREAAISEQEGSAIFDIPSRLESSSGKWEKGTSYSGSIRRFDGVRSLLRLLRRSVMGMLRLFWSHNRYQSIQVSTVRLDVDVPFVPDVVKLDLQGGEADALKGLGDTLRHVKLLKIETQMLRPAGKDRSVQMLREAGFAIFLGDFQFSVPALSDTLRSKLLAHGLCIETELRQSAYDPQTMVIGGWSDKQCLPFNDLDLTPTFVSLLRQAKAKYFQVDLVAVNQSFATSWNAIMPQLIL